MSVKLLYRGRLANQLLIYLMGQYFAEKNNLVFNENIESPEMNANFQINKICGMWSYDSFIEIDDTNFQNYLDANIHQGVYLTGQFQMPGIFRRDDIVKKYKSYIIPQKIEPIHDLFIHIRLGDISEKFGLPVSYYEQQISKINFNKGVIASDSPDHPTVRHLMSKYNMDFLNQSPEFTIRYGSQCKNIVLSYGSFSLMLGLLSNDSDVYFINDEMMIKKFNIFPWMGPAFEAFVGKNRWILVD
jgi:hypothetical protein